jgi:lysyl-tRNA synthetase class 2
MADELLAVRRAKLDRLRADGIDPFPHEFPGVEPVAGVLAAHADLLDGEETDVTHRVAGRLAARRGQGKMAFLDLVDRSGRLQLQARQDVLGDERHERLLTQVDLGDIVGVDGTALRTKRGEISLRIDDFTVLAKSLRPPPEKHHGLQDVETRYRRRELDLMANEEARELFITRAKVVTAVRRELDDAGFVEVETPVLQPLYGGALARPFTTHHNALDRTLYLRIATELYLKRCIVGGLERVYELGKDFRNEGLSTKHNPEFTMVEFYEAYADYNDVADRLESLVRSVAAQVGSTGDIDFEQPWRRVTLRDAIRDATGIDFRAHPDQASLAAAIGDRLPTADRTWPQLVDDLLSKYVEPDLQQPTFLLDYPVELSPFAKAHRSEPGLVERWEAFCGGVEIANAFTELNDPDEQRARFESQARLAAEGDDEAAPYDEVFVQALEHGMPPTGGVGLGIDRLVMALRDRSSIREVVLFPAMRD